MDRNGYNPSIMQEDLETCYFWPCPYCSGGKLDRHEVFPGPNRMLSKKYGLWVSICHLTCHEGAEGVHLSAEKAKKLKQDAQHKAMEVYGWGVDDFRNIFGKNYLEDEE